MVSQHLWDVAVNCSIALDWQLQKLCHQRCCAPGNDACLALDTIRFQKIEIQTKQMNQYQLVIPPVGVFTVAATSLITLHLIIIISIIVIVVVVNRILSLRSCLLAVSSRDRHWLYQQNTYRNELVIFHLDDVTDNHLVPQLIHQLPITQHAWQPVVYMAVATVPLLWQHHHDNDQFNKN